MNLCRLNWSRCYNNVLTCSLDRCRREHIHSILRFHKREYCVSMLRRVLSLHRVGRPKELRLLSDASVLSSRKLGRRSYFTSPHACSLKQSADGSLHHSPSPFQEARDNKSAIIPPQQLSSSKNSDVYSHETEARNFSTVTAQKIETGIFSSPPAEEAYPSRATNSKAAPSDSPSRLPNKSLNIRESPGKEKEIGKGNSANSKRTVGTDSLTYKSIKSKAQKLAKQRTKNDAVLENSEQKKVKSSKEKNIVSKETQGKETSSSSKSKQKSERKTKQVKDATGKKKIHKDDKIAPRQKKTSAKPGKSKMEEKVSLKSNSSGKLKDKSSSGKSQEKRLVLLVPEIPPSELTEDASKMLVFFRRMHVSRPKDTQSKLNLPSRSLSPSTVRKGLSNVETTQRTASDDKSSRENAASDIPVSRRDASVSMVDSMGSVQSPQDPADPLSKERLTEETHTLKAESATSDIVDKKRLVPRLQGNSMEKKSAVTGKKQSRKSAKGKATRIQQAHEDPHQYVTPLLDLCVYKGNMEYAQSVFDTCMKQGRFKDLEVYNTLLQGWANRGNISAIKKLFSLMREGGVQPDVRSFALALECLGRSQPLDKELAEKIIEDIELTGLSLDDIMLKHTFRRDGREVVLQVIQDIRQDFKHPPAEKPPACSLEVVKGLYSGPPASGKTPSRPPLFGIMSKDEMRRKLDLQWKTEEKECINVGSVEEEHDPSQQVLEKRKILAEHKGMWWRGLRKGLEAQKKKHSTKKTFGQMKEHVYPFMTILNDDDYIQLMLESLPRFAATSEGIGTLNLARELGSRVNQRYIIRKKRKNLVAKKTQKLYWDYIQGLMEGEQGEKWTHREQWQDLLYRDQTGPSLDFDTHVWPSGVILKIGNFMADILLREIQIDVSVSTGKREKKLIPGLYHMYSYRSMKQVGFIKPHPLLIDLFQGAKDPDLWFDSNILPMVTPPLPWTSARFGGYPLSATKLMRCKEGSLQSQLILDKAQTSELHPVLDSLNQLGSVPWIVNKKMLDIIIGIFKNEGSKELDIPQPSSVFPAPPPITSDATPEEIAKIHQERAAVRKCQAEMHSLRMDMLYKLSIANHFRDDIFWFPHNMDFRGRVYPCPPHFNHLGSDVTRSLLLFAQGKPLGEKGLDWLKIHLINLSGLKKRCSLEDRLAYANEILPDILDSADRPFEGKKWWQQTDEPWQALACCMEIAAASRSPNHEKFISHLPIHQDGSCNGLQHYAALGRDVIGAQQVNLHPFPVPQDVYSGVAQMVEELREKDAKNGMKIAKALEGSVHRKVVKQTVMTVVYGVTAYGGRHQIFKQLKDMEILSENDAWFAAGYLVLKVFQSLGKMFAKTREIQDWLTESALMISRGGSSVEWVTPLGLPIVQPYHKKSQVWVSSTEKWSLYHNDTTNAKGRPDAQKQKNAFPPNFIHSLDSTHMMLTSLHCLRSGVTFASVHDCFWTHPCTVDLMNKICREQFVRLHEQPILHDLAKNLVEKFGEIEVSPGMRLKHGNPMEIFKVKDYLEKVPETGEFDLKNVSESTYFFS